MFSLRFSSSFVHLPFHKVTACKLGNNIRLIWASFSLSPQ
jgi:hypothetical protein